MRMREWAYMLIEYALQAVISYRSANVPAAIVWKQDVQHYDKSE